MPATVIECTDLDAEVTFFTAELGFRVVLVTPADAPRRVVIERDAMTLELRRRSLDRAVRLRLETAGPDREVRSPGGSVVEFTPSSDVMVVPENRPSLTVVDGASGGFGVGRAGM